MSNNAATVQRKAPLDALNTSPPSFPSSMSLREPGERGLNAAAWRAEGWEYNVGSGDGIKSRDICSAQKSSCGRRRVTGPTERGGIKKESRLKRAHTMH